MQGVNHQKLVDGRYGSHRGSEIGLVDKRTDQGLRVTSTTELQAGDGLLFVDYTSAGKKLNQPATTWGSRIFSAEKLSPSLWEISFANDFSIDEIPTGSHVYLNDSPSIERMATRTVKGRNTG
jgi:hypothetical protein